MLIKIHRFGVSDDTSFRRDRNALQLSRGPTAATKVVSQSGEPPAIAEFNLEFSEVEASRNFLNGVAVLDVVPHSPCLRVHKLQRLPDLYFAFQSFDRLPILNSAKALKLFDRLCQENSPTVLPFPD